MELTVFAAVCPAWERAATYVDMAMRIILSGAAEVKVVGQAIGIGGCLCATTWSKVKLQLLVWLTGPRYASGLLMLVEVAWA